MHLRRQRLVHNPAGASVFGYIRNPSLSCAWLWRHARIVCRDDQWQDCGRQRPLFYGSLQRGAERVVLGLGVVLLRTRRPLDLRDLDRSWAVRHHLHGLHVVLRGNQEGGQHSQGLAALPSRLQGAGQESQWSSRSRRGQRHGWRAWWLHRTGCHSRLWPCARGATWHQTSGWERLPCRCGADREEDTPNCRMHRSLGDRDVSSFGKSLPGCPASVHHTTIPRVFKHHQVLDDSLCRQVHEGKRGRPADPPRTLQRSWRSHHRLHQPLDGWDQPRCVRRHRAAGIRLGNSKQ
mmetsp:Transcript_50346/g.81619  ORF Transcript_50346/g.81619 Transcript_50346/m.81619 type:complete len:292 (+) Transcript_50346:1046-1921(+)